MSINQIKREVREDIKKIDDAIKDKKEKNLRDVHMNIDGKYQNKISEWGMSQFGWSQKNGYIYNILEYEQLYHNLKNMRNKLEGYLQDLDLKTTITNNKTNDINIYNKNENNINNYINNVNFNIIEEKIKDCESLTIEETGEALEKLKELQKIYESKEKRKCKWEKLKNILKWLADKSVDVAIEYFPIIMSTLNK